jgi:hypothetical protein
MYYILGSERERSRERSPFDNPEVVSNKEEVDHQHEETKTESNVHSHGHGSKTLSAASSYLLLMALAFHGVF